MSFKAIVSMWKFGYCAHIGIVQLIIICTACRSRYFVAPLEPSPYVAVQMIVHSHSRDVMEGLTHRYECCKLCFSPISLPSILLQSLGFEKPCQILQEAMACCRTVLAAPELTECAAA